MFSDFGHNCQKKINVINKAVTIRKMYNFVSLSVLMGFYLCTEPQAMIIACIMDIRQTAKKEKKKTASPILKSVLLCFVNFSKL